MCGRGISNSVVGIIGCGNIGTSIAEKLSKFKISQLLYTSRSEKPDGEYQSIDSLYTRLATELQLVTNILMLVWIVAFADLF